MLRSISLSWMLVVSWSECFYCLLVFTLDEFEKYCNDVADTAAWGGQLEVRMSDNMSL